MKITVERIRELEKTINETSENLPNGDANPTHNKAVVEMIDLFHKGHVSVKLLIDILTFTTSGHIKFYGQRALNHLRQL